jgi:amidophosphoribosyltransferase
MCGIVGIVSKSKEVSKDLYCGLYALQHRGKEAAGIVTFDGEKYYSHLGQGEIAVVFRNGDILDGLKGNIGIGHNRYSTAGLSNLADIQPIRGSWKGNEFWLAHNGNLVNAEFLRKECQKKGFQFKTTSDTGVISALISLTSGPSFEQAVKEVLSKLEGAYSLLILYQDQIFAIKDGLGIRPLCLGKKEDGFVVASETCALYHLGASLIREIDPGEFLIIDKTGIKEYFHPPIKKRKFCIFEFVYFLRPDSIIFGRRVKDVQKNMGRYLAKECAAPAEFAVPIPDSGKYGGYGFIEESKIKSGEEAMLRTHLVSRTFIEPVQELRARGVELKFVIMEEEVRGRKIVLIDDSIVRGTTQKRLVNLFKKAGAREIHSRIFSPAYRYPCYYGIDTYRIKDELIAQRHQGDLEKIKSEIGLDSLAYLSLDSLIKAVIEISGKPLRREDFCTACFSCQYPIPVK